MCEKNDSLNKSLESVSADYQNQLKENEAQRLEIEKLKGHLESKTANLTNLTTQF